MRGRSVSAVTAGERQAFEPPRSAEQARERLSSAHVPPEILGVAQVLDRAGHRAVLVGGAVRDVLCGLPHEDWDVATSATPEEVQRLFPRTIPTGVAHGTVTVLTGRGDRASPVEVTTFRGEGVYRDGRRPTEVRFLRELEDDLARRDFTSNALAWDPIHGVFSDPFDGIADLQAGLVRAVGVALDRFLEDGLRTMRAVRFCATLGFSLEASTEAAIGGALEVFDPY
jgi:tRNA nucleotidyltransferase (CCA-adding enzyme)